MDSIRVKGNLTPGFIKNRLSLFLDALTGIQNAINEIKQEPSSSVKIHKIAWEGGRDDQEFWTAQSGTTISLDAAKEALAGLREAIDTLYEQPNNLLLQQAKARAVSRYISFIYESVLQELQGYSEHEAGIYPIIKTRRREDAPLVIYTGASSIISDALDDLESLEEKKQALNHIVGLLKGEEND